MHFSHAISRKDEFGSSFPTLFETTRMLNTVLDQSLDQEIGADDRAFLAKHGDRLHFQKDGYKDGSMVKKAIGLLHIAKPGLSAMTSDWVLFFGNNIWSIFDLTSIFTYT